jgi:hypothetical protein
VESEREGQCRQPFSKGHAGHGESGRKVQPWRLEEEEEVDSAATEASTSTFTSPGSLLLLSRALSLRFCAAHFTLHQDGKTWACLVRLFSGQLI